MKKIYSSFILLLAVIVTQAQTSVSFTIDADGQDAAIDNYVPGRSNPNEIEYNTCAWTISGTPTTWRNLLKFDMKCIPPNAVILSAGLNLYYADTNSYGSTQHSSLTSSDESILQRVSSFWQEDSVTWNNQPAVDTTGQTVLAASTSGTQDYLNIDVTGMVQKMVADPNSNYGFLLRLVNESYYARLIFASGDNPYLSKHPVLNVLYRLPENDCVTFHLDKINEDAAIDDYVPARNNPNEIEYNTCAWTIAGTPVVWRDYFKFDLPCGLENTTIQSAHLSLFYAAQNSYNNATHSSLTSSDESVLQRVTSPWSETSVTWNNQPAVTATDQVTLPQSTSGTEDYLNIDVTNMVRVMQSNTSSNYGFLLRLTTEAQYARLIFASGDNPDSSKHPLLEICYTMPTGISEITDNNSVVFPNPFSDKLNISLTKKIKNGSFTIFNSLGQNAFVKSSLEGNNFQFDNLNLAAGFYFYKIQDGDKIIYSGKVQKIN